MVTRSVGLPSVLDRGLFSIVNLAVAVVCLERKEQVTLVPLELLLTTVHLQSNHIALQAQTELEMHSSDNRVCDISSMNSFICKARKRFPDAENIIKYHTQDASCLHTLSGVHPHSRILSAGSNEQLRLF